ncbi:MAG: hypothetical protein ABUT20_18095 [Bacteroidota bacterium]
MTILFFVVAFIIASCKSKPVEFRTNNCKGSPVFVKRVAGFNTPKSYFSTSEIKTMGLVLVENQGTADKPLLRYYQHPSWKNAGWLSPIQLDEAGNVYTSPAPFINVLNNPVEKQNTIYKIDAVTGEMNEFMQIPLPDSITGNNPYGVLGLLYYCEGNILYVSTISGSDRHVVRGGIYAIDIKTKKIIDHIEAVDAIGMGITYITGERRLFFGTGRSSEIFSVLLNANGKFESKPEFSFSLEGLGPRGDDKVRRIQADANGNLIVHGIEFNYNLIASREKPETQYSFWYNSENKTWRCQSIDSKTTISE